MWLVISLKLKNATFDLSVINQSIKHSSFGLEWVYFKTIFILSFCSQVSTFNFTELNWNVCANFPNNPHGERRFTTVQSRNYFSNCSSNYPQTGQRSNSDLFLRGWHALVGKSCPLDSWMSDLTSESVSGRCWSEGVASACLLRVEHLTSVWSATRGSGHVVPHAFLRGIIYSTPFSCMESERAGLKTNFSKRRFFALSEM